MIIFYLEALAAIALSLSVLMAGAWMVQQRTGNSGWVDTIWTFAVGLVGAGCALWPVADAAPNARQWLVAALVAIWSVRLGLHIAVRTAGASPTTRAMPPLPANGASIRRAGCSCFCKTRALDRSRWCSRFSWRRGFRTPACGLPDYLGALILLIGIAGEALADAQLRKFRADPANKGRVCDVGLWRWSRHPNYFFEWFGWLAYPVIAIPIENPLHLSLGLGELAGAGLHVLDPGARHRHPAARAADAALARRALSRLSVAHQHVLSAATAKGRGHMSVVSRIIGTAERVPLPDLVIRAAIQRLCSRTATRLASGNADKRCLVCRRDGGARHRRTYRRGQRPALRSAGGILRPRARPEPQILLVFLQGAEVDAAGGRGRSAAPDRRARRSRRRPVDPRTRLRLGFAVAVDGAAISRIRDHRGVEFAVATRIYRGRGRRRAD